MEQKIHLVEEASGLSPVIDNLDGTASVRTIGTTAGEASNAAIGTTVDDKNSSTSIAPATMVGILKYLSYLWQSVWSAADTARTTATKVLTVQLVNPDGTVGSASTAVDDAAFTVTSSKGTVMMAVATTDAVDANDQGALAMNIARELRVVMPHSDLPVTHWGQDVTLTYLGVNSLTASATNFTVDATVAIRSLGVTNAANVMTVYNNGMDGITLYAAANVVYITRYGASFTAFLNTDLKYSVAIGATLKAYDPTVDVMKQIEQAPLSAQYVVNTLIPQGTTNIAAATYNYPSVTGLSMDGFKDASLTYRFIDADGTISFLIKATNDPAATSTSFDTIYAYDSKTDANANAWTVTNGTLQGSIDLDNLNYTFFRVDVTFSGATNTAELFVRQKAL